MRIVAGNSVGDGPDSAEATGTPQETPRNPPAVADAPTGVLGGTGQVHLDWNDVEGTTYYQVRVWSSRGWIELLSGEIEITFEGSGATVENLWSSASPYFSVRAGNAAGMSDGRNT